MRFTAAAAFDGRITDVVEKGTRLALGRRAEKMLRD
jgi:hypothetical protein